MNKNWITTTLLLYLAALAVFGYLLLNRKSAEAVIVPIVEIAETPVPKSTQQPVKKDYSYIIKNDLFHPLRGKAPDDENKPIAKKSGSPTRFKFDLRGVFRSGENYGAILLVAGNTPSAKGDLKKANGEIFFQGAEVAEGYILKKVDGNSVTIAHNGEEIVVKLEKLLPPELKSEKEADDKKKEDTPRRPDERK